MSILFGLLLARRFYCRSALSLSPGRTGGLLPRINAPTKKQTMKKHGLFYWQRNRDSNPNKQSQSLSCYRYTIPLKNV